MFFSFFVSLLISFALPAKFSHIFLIVVFAALLCFSCRCFCNISTQDFVSNIRKLLWLFLHCVSPLLLLQLYCPALWKMTLYNSCNLFLLLFPVALIPFSLGQNVWSGCHPQQCRMVVQLVSVNVICCY